MARLRGRVLAIAAAAGLLIGAGCSREDAPQTGREHLKSGRAPQARSDGRKRREIEERISRSIPERVALDKRYLTPRHTILRGHAEDLDGVADLLENLERIAVKEPLLHRATRSERGYEYTIVVRVSAPARQGASVSRDEPGERRPFFAAHPIPNGLSRLLYPPFT